MGSAVEMGAKGDLGVELDAVSEGHCTTSLAIAPRHLQHSGQVHAGVLTTLADLTGSTGAKPGSEPLGPLAVSGSLPVTGEKIDCAGWCFEVVDLDGRRIDKLLATRLTAEQLANSHES